MQEPMWPGREYGVKGDRSTVVVFRMRARRWSITWHKPVTIIEHYDGNHEQETEIWFEVS